MNVERALRVYAGAPQRSKSCSPCLDPSCACLVGRSSLHSIPHTVSMLWSVVPCDNERQRPAGHATLTSIHALRRSLCPESATCARVHGHSSLHGIAHADHKRTAHVLNGAIVRQWRRQTNDHRLYGGGEEALVVHCPPGAHFDWSLPLPPPAYGANGAAPPQPCMSAPGVMPTGAAALMSASEPTAAPMCAFGAKPVPVPVVPSTCPGGGGAYAFRTP